MLKTHTAAAALFAACLLVTPALAQSSDAEVRIEADVAFLADDLLEGRAAGQRGYDLAARYVETRFMGLGLKPAGDAAGTTYRQPVPLARVTVDPSAMIAWGGREWRQGEQVIVQAGGRTGEVNLQAPVVFVGYGLNAPEAGLDDYAGLDVAGKIVVVLGGVPAGLDSELAASLGASKAAAAARMGAVGLLTVAPAPAQTTEGWNRMSSAAGMPAYRLANADGTFAGATSPLQATGVLGPQAADALLGGRLAAIMAEAAAPGVRPKGFGIEGPITLRATTDATALPTDNIAGLLPGSDPALANEIVVVMGHLDHVGMSQTGDDRISNGAMDNAGGIAILLEAARMLAAEPPRRSVLFLAVTAEERGLLGSDHYARNPVSAKDRYVGVVNLDMPILSYDFSDVVAFGGEHSTIGRIAAQAVAVEQVALSPDPMPEQGVFTRSDHYSFVRAGIPSVMLATGYANGGEQAWGDFFAHRYHKPADDLSQTFNWSAASRFARVNAAIARGIADAPARPQWYADSPFGQRFAPEAEKATR